MIAIQFANCRSGVRSPHPQDRIAPVAFLTYAEIAAQDAESASSRLAALFDYQPIAAPTATVRHICADDEDLIEHKTCPVCKERKTVSEFYWRKSRGEYYRCCKKCHKRGPSK